MNKDSQISLTYVLQGEYLLNKGIYTTANVTVKNPNSRKEVFITNKPLQTIKRAEYEKATQQVTLSSSFIEMALERPVKPDGMSFQRWLRTPLGQLYQNWNKLSDEQKVKFHVEQYVIDMGGEDYSYEII
jgi:hypothetical protein